jgi:hypothetical protein
MAERPVRTSVVPQRPAAGTWATPPRIGSDLARQMRDCLADMPWYPISPLLRHWHVRWGADRDEVAAAMPGDALLDQAQYRTTRAITINAPPDEVWPWLRKASPRRPHRDATVSADLAAR